MSFCTVIIVVGFFCRCVFDHVTGGLYRDYIDMVFGLETCLQTSLCRNEVLLINLPVILAFSLVKIFAWQRIGSDTFLMFWFCYCGSLLSLVEAFDYLPIHF